MKRKEYETRKLLSKLLCGELLVSVLFTRLRNRREFLRHSTGILFRADRNVFQGGCKHTILEL